MQTILEALLPIFFLIFMGYMLKRIKFPTEEFWPMADKFTYYILFPSLLIYKLSTASLSEVNGFELLLTAIVSLVILSVLTLITKPLFGFDGASFTSLYQGAVRFNTYVFLALISALLGDQGLILAAFLMAFMIPLLNLLCIVCFALFARQSKITFGSFVNSVVKNPLIMACVIGGLINFLDLKLAIAFEQTLKLLSQAALPLGLLSVGVGLQLKSLSEAKSELVLSTLLKLLIFPAIMYSVAVFMNLPSEQIKVLIIFAAMPTASSAYILAKQLGGNTQLMASIITLQTLAAIGSITLILQLI